MKYKVLSLIAVAGALASSPANAVVVNWADWVPSTAAPAVGTIATSGGPVGVTYTGPVAFVQTSGGTNYWTEPNPALRPYTGGVVTNAPPASDIVALNAGGTKTITFSQTVSDVYLALVSWNTNVFTSQQPFEVISSGSGFWGTGTFANLTSNGFTGNGELHGIIRFNGNLNSITFTDTSENWHGFTVGIAGLAPNGAVPEPATWAFMILGFGAVAGAMRRTQRATRLNVRFAG
jgi:hypothetical protein